MNTTTAITLNDRFSMIKKQPSNTSIPEQRGRSRSRSRTRGAQKQPQPDLRGSRRNQMLLNKLERQHKLRMALKLKNVSLIVVLELSSLNFPFPRLQKSLIASRGRNQALKTRNNFKRAAVIKKAFNTQKLRRSNSLTRFIP